MKTITGSEMCRLVEANGSSLRRIHGSHHIYSKEGERKVISIPVHGNKNLNQGWRFELRATQVLALDV